MEVDQTEGQRASKAILEQKDKEGVDPLRVLEGTDTRDLQKN